MPLANFKVLVRPNPGGLEDHQMYVTKQADELLKKYRFAMHGMTKREKQLSDKKTIKQNLILCNRPD